MTETNALNDLRTARRADRPPGLAARASTRRSWCSTWTALWTATSRRMAALRGVEEASSAPPPRQDPQERRHRPAAGGGRRAWALCCAKLGEAETLAEGGIARGLHITSPVVSQPRHRPADRPERAHRWSMLSVVVDHPANVAALAEAGGLVRQAFDGDHRHRPRHQAHGRVASAEAAVELFHGPSPAAARRCSYAGRAVLLRHASSTSRTFAERQAAIRRPHGLPAAP